MNKSTQCQIQVQGEEKDELNNKMEEQKMKDDIKQQNKTLCD